MNPIRLSYVVLAVLLTAGCSSPDQDPHWRVGAYEGRLEADLRRDVGPPTHDRSVIPNDKDEVCSGVEAVRELMYDIPSQGVAKRLRDVFRMRPMSSYIVCINGTGRIGRISYEEID